LSRFASVVATLAAVVTLTLGLGGQALAHETRQVGPYRFVVGWLNEPAFQGQPNAATVRVSDTRVTPTPKPVEGLERTLTIHVVAGGLTETYTGTLRTVFGQPGLYALHMFPTASGSYTYRIRGKVEDLEINETFESGPGRFNEVEPLTALQYPAKVPVAGELTQRLEAIERGVAVTQIAAVAAAVLALAALGLTLARRRA
jgi:hypothetical protein